MKRILFVDDEPRLLDALKRMLHPQHEEWDMRFVTSGAKALDMLAAEPFDMVVTDMRMPGMDGAELLAVIRERHPEVARIILSGTTDVDITIKSVVAAHQYLAKPCDAQTLRNTIQRAFPLCHLIPARLERIISHMVALPSIPELYLQLLEELRSPDPSIARVASIMEQDPAMTAKMLQLASSACFGFRRHVRTPADAAVYLGLETMSKLAFSAKVFSKFDLSGLRDFSIETLWRHSLATSTLAGKIAAAEGASQDVTEEASLAGLLHDVGKLVFAVALSEEYDKVLARSRREGGGEIETERKLLGASHAEVGAYLLWLWGLPDSIVQAIAFHHCPALCPNENSMPLTAVHVADILQRQNTATTHHDAPPSLDLDYLKRAGHRERISEWRQMSETAV